MNLSDIIQPGNVLTATNAKQVSNKSMSGNDNAFTNLPPVPGQWVEVSRAVADNDATIDFTGIDDSADEWAVAIHGALPSTAAVLWLRTSTDGGSTFDADGSDYHTNEPNQGSGGLAVGDSFIAAFMGTQGTSAAYVLNGGIILRGVGTAQRATFDAALVYRQSSNDVTVFSSVGGGRNATTAVNAVRLLYSTGNISSGTFVLLKRIKP